MHVRHGVRHSTRSHLVHLSQAFYRFYRHSRRKVLLETPPQDVDTNAKETSVTCAVRVPPAAERGHEGVMRWVAYTKEMRWRQGDLARLRKTRRLPLTEAAYNGHYEILEVPTVSINRLLKSGHSARAFGMYCMLR